MFLLNLNSILIPVCCLLFAIGASGIPGLAAVPGFLGDRGEVKFETRSKANWAESSVTKSTIKSFQINFESREKSFLMTTEAFDNRLWHWTSDRTQVTD